MTIDMSVEMVKLFKDAGSPGTRCPGRGMIRNGTTPGRLASPANHVCGDNGR